MRYSSRFPVLTCLQQRRHIQVRFKVLPVSIVQCTLHHRTIQIDISNSFNEIIHQLLGGETRFLSANNNELKHQTPFYI